ncbi:MAG: 50S ribosomal protein L30 [Peptococcaceae bacterium]|nr:50S ribosomal protein L30 [Peptococcaceae bacterium]
MGKLKITLTKSLIGRPEKQRAVVRSLGLSKINQTVVQEDSPSIRGMVAKVGFLMRVEELGEVEKA